MLLGLLHVHITSPSCMNSGCIISVSFVTIPASSAPLNPPPPILTMPPKVGPPPDDKSEVASPSPISTNASSNQTSPPPSPKAPANSSTKPQELSPPPPSTSPPQNLPPPPPASGSLQKPPPPPINWPPPSDRHNLPPPPSIPPPSSVPPPPSVPPPSSVPPPPSVPPPSSVPPPPSVPPPSSVPPPPSVPPHAPSYIYGTPTGPPVYPPPPLLSPPPSSVTLESPPPPLLSPPPTSKTLVFPPPALLPPPPSSSRTRESPPPPLLPPPSTSGIPIAPTPPLLHPPPTSVIAVSPTSLHISPITPSGMSLVPQVTPTKDMSNNSPKNEGGALGTRTAVEIGVTVSLMLLAAIGITFCFMCLRKKKYSRHSNYLMRAPSTSSTASGIEYLKMWHSPANSAYSSSEISGLGNSRCLFTYKELAKATNEFSEKNLLGEGGFGLVFKGCLPDGREVAVKQLKEGGGQGEREFRAEVETISHIHHKHLVSLVGYCICKSNRLLIYDYVPNKTLHFHLHEKEDPVLDWAARLKIALGAARGIAYLHEDCQPRIIHRDIKSSNILIDNNFEAQVSDFGLARLFSDSYTHVTTRVMGTFGYMAPEYALSGKLTDKSDVFSFGVVLLELITGRKPVDSSQPSGEESLVEWARPLLDSALEGEDLEALVDPRLKDNYVDSEMFRLIEAAASCIRYFAAKRPKMMQVLRSFDGITVSNISNGMRVGESKMCDVTLKSGEFRLLQNMAFGGQYFSSEFYTQGSWKREDCEM